MPSPLSMHASRRQFLTAAALTAGFAPLAAACGTRTAAPKSLAAAIQAAEHARPHTGTTRSVTLTPRARSARVGADNVTTWLYGDRIPAPVLRANVGDDLAVTVNNQLPQTTSVHWHGIALRNDMDGVSPASSPVEAGGTSHYRFSVPDAGTYWFHPHVGVQTDYGLYGALIIDDPNEKAAYDLEWVVILDDWTDGVGVSPDKILSTLAAGSSSGMSGMSGMGGGSSASASSGSMAGMSGIGSSALLGGDAGDVVYPLYLINGRTDPSPDVLTAKPGQRVRLRIINAGGDTAFRVALAGHQLSVTHADGYPVTPTKVDALLLGMGERYDAIVTLGDGVFPLVASAEGKNASTRALIRTGAGAVPPQGTLPAASTGRVGVASTFTAAEHVRLPQRTPDVRLTARMGGSMGTYVWTINGQTYDHTVPLKVSQGQRVRLTFSNQTMMWHPMHLHGHTYQVLTSDGSGPRKDTTIVLPMQSVSVDFQADNPGQWMLHCHNAYHAQAGMMTRLDYT
jgi:FtsP/CotA-like multicopper oxidase with cupredoxin domain